MDKYTFYRKEEVTYVNAVLIKNVFYQYKIFLTLPFLSKAKYYQDGFYEIIILIE